MAWGRKKFEALGPSAWVLITLILFASVVRVIGVDVNWALVIFFVIGWSAGGIIRAVKRRGSATRSEDSSK